MSESMLLLLIVIMYCCSHVILSIRRDMKSLDIKCCRSLRHSQTVSPYYQWPRRSVHLTIEKMIQTEIKRHKYDLSNKSIPPDQLANSPDM